MNKEITITRYGIQENEDGELLVAFFKENDKEFIASCNQLNFYLKKGDLHIQLKNKDDEVILKFTELKKTSLLKLMSKKRQALLLLEIDDDDTFHYLVMKNQK